MPVFTETSTSSRDTRVLPIFGQPLPEYSVGRDGTIRPNESGGSTADVENAVEGGSSEKAGDDEDGHDREEAEKYDVVVVGVRSGFPYTSPSPSSFSLP